VNYIDVQLKWKNNVNFFKYNLVEHSHNPLMLWFSQWIQDIDRCRILILFLWQIWVLIYFFLFPFSGKLGDDTNKLIVNHL
jgi:hypothetical protein